MISEDYEIFPESYDKSSVRIISTPSAAAKKSFFYVQETGYLKILSTHRTERRNLNSFLIVYVTGGTGSLEYDGRTYALKKGQCFFIDCMKSHSYYSSEDDPWELLWVHFNGATSKEYFDIFYKNSSPVFFPKDSLRTECVLREMIEINRESSHDSEAISSLKIVTLLTQALQGGSRRKFPDGKAAQIKQYLNSHYTEHITLESLELEFYLSKYYIEKEFKKCYGITVFGYIIAKRINLAKRLLRFTDKTIDEISHMCGFSDQSYFNRQFKKAEGITGTAFRKKWRN